MVFRNVKSTSRNLQLIFPLTRLLIFTVTLSFLGCTRPVEKITETYPDGKPKIIRIYPDENDSLSYRKKVFYNSGKPDYIGEFVNGKKTGTWTWWYENGNKKDQCTYIKGLYVDTVFHWYESGRLQQLEILPATGLQSGTCDVCSGTIIRYFENGKLKEKFSSSEKGVLNGAYTRLEENGAWEIKNYSNGLLEGPTVEHTIDSVGNVIIVVGQYANDKEIGYWQWFNGDSVLYQTLHYEQGVVSGLHRTYFANGRVESEGSIKNGKYQGLVLYYDSLGKIVEKVYHENEQPVQY